MANLTIPGKKFILVLAVIVMAAIGNILVRASATDGTIDSVYRYAWSENFGWVDFGTVQGNAHVTDSALTGYAWGENVGWISLNCANDNSCGTVNYKVQNNGSGALFGHAWGENTGWIDFSPNYGGVIINSSGEFTGYAWGENTGWIVFNCSATNSCGGVDYKVKTDWRPQSERGGRRYLSICGNYIDDDGDGKIDYPSDPGCSSSGDEDETDDPVYPGGTITPSPLATPVSAVSPAPTPSPSQESADSIGNPTVLINNQAEFTDSRIVTLNLSAGSGTKKMTVSNSSDFSGSVQEDYQNTKTWTLLEGDGLKTVYVNFYAQDSLTSKIASDSIILREQEDFSEEPKKPPLEITSNPGSGRNLSGEKLPGKNIWIVSKLKELGFLPKEAEFTGELGPAGWEAVKEFQESKGIYPVSAVGPRTIKALNAQEFITNRDYQFTKDIKYGDKNREVKELQTRLRDRNFFPHNLPSTGWFGPITQKAVDIFQKFYKIVEDGVVGERTREELNR